MLQVRYGQPVCGGPVQYALMLAQPEELLTVPHADTAVTASTG